jgi:hypothetical protein
MLAVRDPIAGPSLDRATSVVTARNGAPFRGAAGPSAGMVWLAGEDARTLAARLAGAAEAARELAAVDVFPAPDLVAVATPSASDLPQLRFQVDADGACHLRVGFGRIDAATAAVEAHLAAPLAADGTALLFAPATDGRCAGHAFVLTHGAAEPVAAAAARAAATSAPPADAGWPRRWRIAFQAIGQHNRRPPLLEIARALGAARCRDALLVADEALLIEFTERLARELTPADADAPWPFERALWRSLLPRLERDELPDALHAHCLRQLGAMADDTGALRSALDACGDGTAFVRAVREDNVGALGDHDAAWRVRGLDWLRRQDVVVPGFDPLGDAEGRRRALRAFLDAEAAAETAR